MEKERRIYDPKLEVRKEEDSEKMIVEGYAVRFNEPATHGFTEIISPTAFNECDMHDVCMKYNHDDSHLILARTRNNSLKLKVDNEGLYIRAELIDTTSNRDVYKMIQAGLLDKQSFAFTIPDDGEEWDLKSETRTITKIDRLFDVSVVDTPFYETTSIYARSLDKLENLKKEEELENLRKQEEEEKQKRIRAKKEELRARLNSKEEK